MTRSWFIVLCLLACGCGKSPPAPASAPENNQALRVVTTTNMLTDLVKRIGGDAVTVEGLMGAGVDPHLYKPTPGDINKLRAADLVVYNGLHLEGQMIEVLENLGKTKPVIAATKGIDAGLLLKADASTDSADPHVWFDPSLWSQCAREITRGLAKARPAAGEKFEKNLTGFNQETAELISWGRARLAEVPTKGRVLITSHDAFNYFARAFDLQVLGVQGISTTSEAGLGDLSRMVAYIKENRIKAVFTESSVSAAAIDRIVLDSGAKKGGEIFSDAMGDPGTMEKGSDGISYDVGTYHGMLRHNINTMVEALK